MSEALQADREKLENEARRIALKETKKEMKADLVAKRPEKIEKMRSLQK